MDPAYFFLACFSKLLDGIELLNIAKGDGAVIRL